MSLSVSLSLSVCLSFSLSLGSGLIEKSTGLDWIYLVSSILPFIHSYSQRAGGQCPVCIGSDETAKTPPLCRDRRAHVKDPTAKLGPGKSL